MRSTSAAVRVAFAATALAAGSAAALDQPISGARLVVQRQGAKQRLSFLSKDPAFLFPAIGSADDPGTGNPGGVSIEILSADAPTALLAVPPGAGRPGWVASARAAAMHRFTNATAPAGVSVVRTMTLRQGTRLQVSSRDGGVALTGTTTAIAIRVTSGTLRNCARFDGASIRSSEPGRFVAAHAPAPAIPDCSNASLLGTAVPCDASGYPTCGGACPPATGCAPVFAPLASGGSVTCSCIAGTNCTNGFAYGGAPEEGIPFGCYPIPCGGSYPTCSTTCGDGGVCSPFALDFATFTGCLCAIPIDCDDVEHGYVCGAGESCRIGLNGSRACGVP